MKLHHVQYSLEISRALRENESAMAELTEERRRAAAASISFSEGQSQTDVKVFKDQANQAGYSSVTHLHYRYQPSRFKKSDDIQLKELPGCTKTVKND